MLVFLKNLWAICRRLPAIIAIIRTIIDVVGSETVQAFLEAIRDAVIKEKGTVEPPKTDTERRRLWDRILRRRALVTLGMTEATYDAYCKANNISGKIPEEVTV